jgi:hypothetical protein
MTQALRNPGSSPDNFIKTHRDVLAKFLAD